MKAVSTKDGSPTFWNEKVGEHYHSITGAKEEAFRKFVEPSQLSMQNNPLILDVCFGWGYNTAAALDVLQGKDVTIIGLENDEHILHLIPTLSPPFSSYPFIQKCIKNKYTLTDGHWSLAILLGDARETIKRISDGSVNCVFLDPFSPKKQPELWTFDFITKLFRVLKMGGRLTTYSCARLVRDNLRAAGFAVSDGPCVGRRGPSTIAKKV